MSNVSLSSYTPVTNSSQVTFTGLGNGTDFNQLITKLVGVEQTRITKLQSWRQTWVTKQKYFKELNTELLSLQTTLKSMDTIGEFMAKTTTSSDTSILTVTTGTGADDGSHKIEVNKLASAKNMVTVTGYASADTHINTSNADVNFSYVYQGKTYDISVGANCTLSELAGLINNDANNAGVKASVVNDGSKYYLQLRGMDTGDAATLVIASNSALSGFTSSDFEVTASNCNAQLKLDGWPSGSSYITRASNNISDLVTGLTLNLKDTGTVTITTTTDTKAIKSNIQTFVEEMNTVRALIKELTAVDTTNATGSILTGNYGVQLIGSDLESVVASAGIGFNSKDTYSVLSQLGIYTDSAEGSTSEGLLLISNATLDAILLSNADAVAKLFANNYAGSTSTSAFAISSYLSGTTGYGTFDVAYTTNSNGKIIAATINGHSAMFSSNSSLITGTYPNSEAGLVLNCIDTTPNSTITGTVSLRQGKVGELINVLSQLTSSTEGPLNILDENYTDIVKMIDNKISYEQTRISNYASRLRTKFAKVDSLLSKYTAQQTALTSYINQLTSS